ncbi:uncharacterized protein LOC121870342 [Homarus americanus]|uniref:uncharacterized protein LOC121870342 n=1 Tax=Homarus americanus TaxID=6706 RepID=UPI001C43AD92|nr:uncharacterized protein LOC121870342 [Homarus americanus]
MWAVMLVGVVAVLGVVVGGEEEGWIHQNMATTHRQSPELGWGTAQNMVMRRPGVWQETTPNNPFLLSSSRPVPPHQRKNNFIMDDDYEDNEGSVSDEFWLSQARFTSLNPHNQQHSTSLKGLQHLLEGQVSPGHYPTKVDQLRHEGVPTHLPNTYNNKQMNRPQHPGRRVNLLGRSDPRTAQPLDYNKENIQVPIINRENFPHAGTVNPNRLSEDVHYNYDSETGIPQPFSSQKKFPEDFISNTIQYPQDYNYPDKFPKESFTSDRSSQFLPHHERFPINLFGDGQLPGNYRQHNMFRNVDNQDSQDHMTVPEPFLEPYTMGDFTHQQPLVNEEPFGDFQTFPHHIPAGVLESGGRGWLQPSLSGLNLPSSKNLIYFFTNPEMTKEGRREACHALNLHTCGTRVINEFTYERDHLETCRIREVSPYTEQVGAYRVLSMPGQYTEQVGAYRVLSMPGQYTEQVGAYRVLPMPEQYTEQVGAYRVLPMPGQYTEQYTEQNQKQVGAYRVLSMPGQYTEQVGEYRVLSMPGQYTEQVGEYRVLSMPGQYTEQVGEYRVLSMPEQYTEQVGEYRVLSMPGQYTEQVGAYRVLSMPGQYTEQVGAYRTVYAWAAIQVGEHVNCLWQYTEQVGAYRVLSMPGQYTEQVGAYRVLSMPGQQYTEQVGEYRVLSMPGQYTEQVGEYRVLSMPGQYTEQVGEYRVLSMPGQYTEQVGEYRVLSMPGQYTEQVGAYRVLSMPGQYTEQVGAYRVLSMPGQYTEQVGEYRYKNRFDDRSKIQI